MQIILTNISISVFELIFIAIIPAILIILGIAYILISKKQLKTLQSAVSIFNEKLDDLKDYSIGHLSELELFTDECEYQPLERSMKAIIRDSKNKYDKKWLPQLNDQLNQDTLTSKQLQTSLYFTPAILVFTCGLIASFVLALMPLVNAESFNTNKMLITLPSLVATVLALFLLNHRSILEQEIEAAVQKLILKIEHYLPVYTDKASLALLVNEMTGHEDKINSAMTEFNQNFEDFVSDDFRNNISDSVKEVMQAEIVPPIKKSSDVLSDLASSLAEQQSKGMSDLADSFAKKLHTSVKNNFDSLTGELNSFNLLMDDTRNFIHDSVAILENSRQQNILLNREVSESIKLMTIAKNDIANELAEMADNLEVISDVTAKMTSVYAGEDANLKNQIASLETALQNSLSTINESISQSEATIKLSTQLNDDQNKHSDLLTSKMDDLLKDLEKINSSISHSTDNFQVQSNEKIDKTLDSFEAALANIVERLVFTTAEIKEAVEALPLVINSFTDKKK